MFMGKWLVFACVFWLRPVKKAPLIIIIDFTDMLSWKEHWEIKTAAKQGKTI